ncbi:1-(5-phosphoribosyl)-5-amino-4-imidazole-carboxylate carboxylase [Moorella thermoacetica]|uniref:AIR carboxylase n=2 Tax=Neomoorella thermoacetica TaxID=1525 RepID=A0A1D7X8K9_NEOTH|nr:nickel pincer cofactor biosynthesis protein LarB [Moorella thermoacetica]AKX93333.1 AIR carboxylase [Moorella thermoacetica]AKX95976.1 AIR carboxylase [Moorella thermoacetica]AOQ23243.1 AIR carboxylase [Moorella thermoacetica]OIQ08235.1 AIR carboxylase [Moorella thermoacetica]OIQ12050.1 AIR carboxylase [Moorella thermoacetica]
MNQEQLKDLLLAYKNGQTDLETVMNHLKHLGDEDLGFAKVDHHRALRNGFPEVIFGQGKTREQVVAIACRLAAAGSTVLVTRTDRETYQEVAARLPAAEFNELARTIVVDAGEIRPTGGRVAVLSAGTADLPVAEEAAVTAAVMGNEVERIYDVGVAGIHRLLGRVDLVRQADVVIVVAGMEGALASVVAGLVDRPVIAVPTSVGYGASFGGLAALLTMLNSCASGIGVVNIDNGFGAAALATTITRLKGQPAEKD